MCECVSLSLFDDVQVFHSVGVTFYVSIFLMSYCLSEQFFVREEREREREKERENARVRVRVHILKLYIHTPRRRAHSRIHFTSQREHVYVSCTHI